MQQNDSITAMMEAQLKHSMSQNAITATDCKLIREYLNDRIRKGKIQTGKRAVIIANALCAVRSGNYIPEYSAVTTDAVMDCFTELRARGHYSQNTRAQFHIIVKSFIKYLNKKAIVTVNMDEINEVQQPETLSDAIKPSDVLHEADFNKLIDHCETARDKALMTLFVECGARPKELKTLRWSDVTFNGETVQVRLVDAKKPSVWKIAFVTKRVQYVVDLRKAQSADSDNDFVFRQYINSRSTKISRNQFKEEGMRYLLKYVFKSAGLTYPKGHVCKLLRASNVTQQLIDGVNPVAIAKSHWSAGVNSKMLGVYEKLASVETENMFLSAKGEAVEARKKVDHEAAKNMICTCGHVNPAGAKFCLNCGCSFDKCGETREERLERELAEMKANMALILSKLNSQ